MREIYFDNAATTKVSDFAIKEMVTMMTETYGNPSSLHQKGYDAELKVEAARNQIASVLKVDKKEIVFTSGGTEANNLAIWGSAQAYKRRGKHILISGIEHPSVREAAKALLDEGFQVEVIPADDYGRITPEDLTGCLREDTILVSIMHVNNEIGTIQPIESLANAIKEKNPTCIFHVDGVQAFGKMIIHPQKIGLDLYTISSHKIHGPKGVGAIYISPKVNLIPIFKGGDQQKGLRSGTENVPGIIGFGEATKEAYQYFEERHKKISDLKAYMMAALTSQVEGITIHSPSDGANHILNIRVVGVKSEVLLHTLEKANIFVSTGSACSSKKKSHSATLQAIGKKEDESDQAIRLSFSHLNETQEIDIFIAELNKHLPVLRRFVRK